MRFSSHARHNCQKFGQKTLVADRWSNYRYGFSMLELDTSPPPRLSQMLDGLVADPFNVTHWEALSAKLQMQNDNLSVESITIIIAGLKQLRAGDSAAVHDKAPPQPSDLSRAIFRRLARDYNSAVLFQQVGAVYLRELNLPEIALTHLKQAVKLGGLGPELDLLIAAVGRPNQPTQGKPFQREKALPTAAVTIAKTGKLAMVSRLRPPAAERSTARQKEELNLPLPETKESCLMEAEGAISKRLFHRSEALLLKAERLPGSNDAMWQAWTDLGVACFESGLFFQVEQAFSEAIKHNPDDTVSYFNLALGHHINGKYESAFSLYKKAGDKDPEQAKIWVNLGVLYFQKDDYAASESALRRATSLRPDYGRAWDNLAAALGAQGKVDEALAACDRAIEIDPTYPEAHFKKAIIFFNQDDYVLAIREFHLAQDLPTLHAHCRVFKAIIHCRQDEKDLAESILHQTAAASPTCDFIWIGWSELGQSWFKQGNFSRAAAAYTLATLANPEESEVWFGLAASFEKLGESGAAENAFQQGQDLKARNASRG